MADGGGAVRLPTSNRGVNPSDWFRFSVGIDWLTFSADLTAVLDDQGWHKSVRDTYLDLDGGRRYASVVAAGVYAYFFAGSGLAMSEEVKSARFYTCSVELHNAAGEYVGAIQFGGPHTLRKDGTRTVRVELTGDGCRMFEAGAGADHAKRWLALQAKLESVGGRLTRVDTAFDDLDGVHSVALAREMWEGGQFTAQGGRPLARYYDDCGTNKGCTFYVGAPTSEKQLRVYEKDKEQGDPDGTRVRWEVQHRGSTRRVLPLEILSEPAKYLRGAYPALVFVSDCIERICTAARDAAASCKRAMKHVRRQYGATLNAIARHFPTDEGLARVVRALTRPKLPAWALKPIGSSEWPVVLAASTTQEMHHAR